MSPHVESSAAFPQRGLGDASSGRRESAYRRRSPWVSHRTPINQCRVPEVLWAGQSGPGASDRSQRVCVLWGFAFCVLPLFKRTSQAGH